MDTAIVARPTRRPEIDQAIQGLLSELKDNSAMIYKAEIDRFLEWAGQAEGLGSPAVVLSAYLHYLRSDKALSGSTINKKHVILRRFFEWLKRVGVIDAATQAEVNAVKRQKVQGSKAGNWLTLDQLQCLINAPDRSTESGRRDRAALALLIGCALRRSEVCSVTWDQIVRRGKSWAIRNLSRKHGRMQDYVAVPDWVMEILEEHRTLGASGRIIYSYDRHGNKRDSIAPESLYRIVKQYAAQCGFEVISPHDLRRSWARAASTKGVPLTQIQVHLGHASVTTTQQYINEIMDLDTLSDAVQLEV